MTVWVASITLRRSSASATTPLNIENAMIGTTWTAHQPERDAFALGRGEERHVPQDGRGLHPRSREGEELADPEQREVAMPQGGEGDRDAARERQTHRCQVTRADTAEPATRPSLDVEVGWITFKAIAMMHSRGRFRFLGSVIIVCAAAMSARQAPAQVPARPTPATPAGRGERAPDYPERPPAPPEQIARGQQLFKSNCSFCHGSDARGGETGPNLVRYQVVLADQHGELIAPVVQND